MSPKILILSSLYDYSTDLVTLQLQNVGVPFVRLNREQFADHRLTLDPVVPELTVCGSFRYTPFRPGFRRRLVPTARVSYGTSPPIPLSPEEQLDRSQWTAFLRALCVFRHAVWMNSPAATYLAESKPYQLSIAANCGFQVPETLATNDASRLQGEVSR